MESSPSSVDTAAYDDAVDVLTAALEERDSYTRSHCDRVVRLAVELGKAFKISNSELMTLRISAQCHDVGKIGIPDCILLKPGKLNAEEWESIKTHSVRGERIFRMTHHPYVDVIAPVIQHHHESVDGSGYPDGLKGEDIPFLSRILLVADAYDAMATSRPYHQGRQHDEIMAIINAESDKKFDPYIIKEFLNIIEHSTARVN